MPKSDGSLTQEDRSLIDLGDRLWGACQRGEISETDYAKAMSNMGKLRAKGGGLDGKIDIVGD